MRALVYEGPFKVAVKQVEDPKIQHPNDVIVHITSTCICGSDLHMYEGRTAAQPGIVFGHENMGIVEEVGSGVVTLHKGDRVVLPFNVACGFCKNCERGYTAFCLTVNPGFAGGAYGYVAMGPYSGGQAEYLRVPFADFNALQLPAGTEHEEDFAMLPDIFPTGYHGAELAQVAPGESVVVFGAGPVGLMAAYSSLIRGAAEVYIVDRVPERLQKAKEIGAIPIDFSKSDPVQQIRDMRHGDGVDKGIDAVGYQGVAPGQNKEAPSTVLDSLIRIVNATGMLGVPGLYVPSDPGGVDPHAKEGRLLLPFGKLWEKGLQVGTGQCNVKHYIRHLRDLIIAGRAKPSFVVSNVVPLNDAPIAYDKFDKRIEGYTKVILKP
ncbi:glutathione-independent formaldehyde dehydrogenase [Ktedonobacter racemifer]|uniref:Alcohol dehydrogenase GroES domain protein n=1 Tax=Ktedonobacter racemifer DSM 44963 TaxID=485913 RepID=D6TBV0_KTERA|nr:glutathione-independent formaldehyde dehydrogenase [Ktedonobacter racemifer]EFH89882.1 Alcohol dehydrogenase GroES domain protein [Ktedonobacter racemifer DSM 44963]